MIIVLIDEFLLELIVCYQKSEFANFVSNAVAVGPSVANNRHTSAQVV
ncbi:Uncharacterised protein [Streptococcus pneumoniae]|nr:Uncharacterised protein [Streptococcus pneumoniae]